MKRNNALYWFILIVLIVFIAININGINDFLSFHQDKGIDFGHSLTVVPQAWNTTDDVNSADESKTSPAITNGYVYIDHWDDWPEDTITSVSEAKFKEMENGGYKVLKTENCTLNGVAVSKQYFINPSRTNDSYFSNVGVNYVFSKEDTNYAVQVHYFTEHDYKNSTFLKQIDDCVGNDIENIHNKEYNEFVSGVWHVSDAITKNV